MGLFSIFQMITYHLLWSWRYTPKWPARLSKVSYLNTCMIAAIIIIGKYSINLIMKVNLTVDAGTRHRSFYRKRVRNEVLNWFNYWSNIPSNYLNRKSHANLLHKVTIKTFSFFSFLWYSILLTRWKIEFIMTFIFKKMPSI